MYLDFLANLFLLTLLLKVVPNFIKSNVFLKVLRGLVSGLKKEIDHPISTIFFK